MKKEKASKEAKFVINEYIICPSHGLGKVVSIEEEEVASQKLVLYVILFERDKMKIKIPLNRMKSSGIRRLVSNSIIERVFEAFRTPSKMSRVMWSKRSQEYESKLYSGDIILAAEVVRDLFRNINDPSRSYSERVLFEAALLRVNSEIAAVTKKSLEQVEEEVSATLQSTYAQFASESSDEISSQFDIDIDPDEEVLDQDDESEEEDAIDEPDEDEDESRVPNTKKGRG